MSGGYDPGGVISAMMPEDIKQRLRTRPFQPIRIHLTDGAKYDVFHPDVVLVSRTEVIIGRGGDDERVHDKFVYCDPLHIVRIEPIAGNGSTNGKRKRR